jgi:hypothetical protein
MICPLQAVNRVLRTPPPGHSRTCAGRAADSAAKDPTHTHGGYIKLLDDGGIFASMLFSSSGGFLALLGNYILFDANFLRTSEVPVDMGQLRCVVVAPTWWVAMPVSGMDKP